MKGLPRGAECYQHSRPAFRLADPGNKGPMDRRSDNMPNIPKYEGRLL